ncbi:programmed cell death protein [Nitzschia inconspicua]|uniref:Programmed cell death protein n=1 Tax=Nitzschia inconspicua TaxID=303405 RepID=A0A9K3KXE1_9STRA|nr:programmed cell death protein [Nitzschia inconspicua]
MWNSEEDTGEPVKLFVPGQASNRKTNTAPIESHIGGHCSAVDDTPPCEKCNNPMYLLVQLKLPAASVNEDRFLCLFVCPRTECFGQVPYDKGFASGGQGVVKCIEKRLVATQNITPVAVAAPTKSMWYADQNDKNENDGDDWAVDGMGGTDAIALEQAVAAMEENLDENGMFAGQTKQQSKKISRQTRGSRDSGEEELLHAFVCYVLKEQNEPPPPRPMLEEDDVGMADSDEKIRNMLARYMAEEEDEDILAALQGTEIGGGGGSGTNGAEEDERLSEEDRILRGFQDRLRRLPRQVVRYARGGTPLWSIPDKNKKLGKHFWTVPNCEKCQRARTFECQVLPSILETLDVDKYTENRINASNHENEIMDLDDLLSDGMNFGSIAVFTCNNPGCDATSIESFVVIQKSVDDIDSMRRPANKALPPTATMAVVENLDDDDKFEPDQ